MEDESKKAEGLECGEEKLPMRIGVDEWCFHNSMLVGRMTLEDVVSTAAEMGAAGIGFDYFMMSREARKSPARLRELIEANKLELVFGFGAPFALPDVVFQALGSMKNEMFELAHSFGSKILRVCGGVIVPNMFHRPFHITIGRSREVDEVAQRLKQFTRDASLEGLTVALENHADYTVDEMLRIIHHIDSDKFKITLDTGNAVYLGEDPVETAGKLAPYTVYTHIKDMKHVGPMLLSVPIGHGEVDIPAIVQALKNNYYVGLYSIECNLPLWQVEQEEQALRDSIKYLQSLAD
jgi:sugar phosphate isomerase/epimerase